MSQGQAKATACAFLLALYGQKETDSLNTAGYKMYMSRKKPPPLKKVPPIDSRNVKEGGVVTPSVSNAPEAPQYRGF